MARVIEVEYQVGYYAFDSEQYVYFVDEDAVGVFDDLWYDESLPEDDRRLFYTADVVIDKDTREVIKSRFF